MKGSRLNRLFKLDICTFSLTQILMFFVCLCFGYYFSIQLFLGSHLNKFFFFCKKNVVIQVTCISASGWNEIPPSIHHTHLWGQLQGLLTWCCPPAPRTGAPRGEAGAAGARPRVLVRALRAWRQVRPTGFALSWCTQLGGLSKARMFWKTHFRNHVFIS